MVHQSMPRSTAAAIIEVVAQDDLCRQLIPGVSPFSIAQSGAGGFRNLVNMTAEGLAWLGVSAVEWSEGTPSATRVAKEYWEKQGVDQACTSIGAATEKAINSAVARQLLPEGVKAARTVDRSPAKDNDVFAFHTATGIDTTSGKTYVFDWHATLMLRNPMISRSVAEWQRGDNRFRSAFSTFQGWG